mmetsp:Transcript_49282/g.94122  ORF Transcript_49282/g.94122 Transcript_49282/m.94122 type:complete len:139 (+) Transcript_49282:3386-3802(+)|eukprot:CAMPEP_0114256992 /NCGR_PEP_ID=MMETSP0058-20121206/18475_1 /TAXON_ID=36894 /ORGANISM="Pyramimonas parkeae, CCMP726" /LENGTH=138 /DNA_ID=CAMNT_0001371649 /DNA_START=740 /DNA_END=1156 /DNA_ORIENTATION=-
MRAEVIAALTAQESAITSEKLVRAERDQLRLRLEQVKHHVSVEQKQEAHGDASLVEEYLRINCTLEAETQRLCAQLQAYQDVDRLGEAEEKTVEVDLQGSWKLEEAWHQQSIEIQALERTLQSKKETMSRMSGGKQHT